MLIVKYRIRSCIVLINVDRILKKHTNITMFLFDKVNCTALLISLSAECDLTVRLAPNFFF